MKNEVTLKLAASGLMLGLTAVACKPVAGVQRPVTASSKAGNPELQALKAFAQVEAAARTRDYVKALPFAEQAVALSPRDVAYRMVLADLYVKNGRFASAEATYGDVLALNPTNKKAALSRALAQIAQGKKLAALATLDMAQSIASPADIGLAYALAGETQRAVSLLEPAARTEGADARVRQNLALAYALSGDWQKAQVTAAQDISPADLPSRMEQWAAFVQPATSYDQVASLLGVTPAADPGQPVQLALVQPAPQTAFAEAAPTPAPQPPVAIEAVPAPAAVVEPDPMVVAEVPVGPSAAAVESTEQVQYAAAAETLVKPEPAIIAAPAAPYKTAVAAFEPAKKAPRPVVRQAAATTAWKAGGRFVVQLGAFSSQAAIDRAWKQAQVRYGLGEDERALTTTISLPGKGLLHRLSVAGFDNRAEATQLCETIKIRGGACFVRETAGDAPVQWASLRQRSRGA